VISRSHAAFRHTVRNFCALYPKVYFWTFTFPEVLDVPEARARWRNFITSLWKYGRTRSGEQTIVGIRVFEIHPGGHGLHIHCLFNRYIHKKAIEHRIRQCGLGRSNVIMCEDKEKLADYLGKYLSKQDRSPALKGVRLWQCVGQWGQTKCKDIEIQSEFAVAYRKRRSLVEAEAEVCKLERIPFRKESNFETMMWAKCHVEAVRTGRMEPLAPECWHRWGMGPDDVELTWDDWDGIFSQLEEYYFKHQGSQGRSWCVGKNYVRK